MATHLTIKGKLLQILVAFVLTFGIDFSDRNSSFWRKILSHRLRRKKVPPVDPGTPADTTVITDPAAPGEVPHNRRIN